MPVGQTLTFPFRTCTSQLDHTGIEGKSLMPRTRVILRRVKTRPRQITVFIGLQCASLALGAVKLPMDWSHCGL